ncbi:glycine zipper 2TM domain-containing protein [Aurantiacibacter hainanensis]|uniref:glycine zipper 2TM domain-containing protein n=1 Tax=Aurantiacibacter hainanensis TaxID=3076114 RepID=UPI0030C71A33
MSNRTRVFLPALIGLALSAPVAAQDAPLRIEHVDVLESGAPYEGEWQGQWQDGDTWRGTWTGTYSARADEDLREWRNMPAGENLGYSRAERDAWLFDCRLVMAGRGDYYGHDRYYDGYYDDGPDGALIGGLLGAAVGGVAGNRIADGDRLAGTLIGAGVGAVAGAAIGSQADGDDYDYEYRELDPNQLWAERYCDAYLARYEMSAAWSAPQHGQHGHHHGPQCRTIIRVELVEDEAPPPARRAISPRPQPGGKTVPID